MHSHETVIILISITQPANDARTTLLQRYYNVLLTSFPRPHNVVLMSVPVGYKLLKTLYENRNDDGVFELLNSVRFFFGYTVYVDVFSSRLVNASLGPIPLVKETESFCFTFPCTASLDATIFLVC